MRALRIAALVVLAAMVAACAPFRPAGGPAPGAGAEPDMQIVRTALAQVGVRYRYGGADPARGFDCSGLVAYVFGQQGVAVPRTAAQQFAAARPVAAKDLRPGDLVFFRLDGAGRAVSHVGIYTGDGRFVHAPQAGRSVTVASLGDEFYQSRFAGYGRITVPASPRSAPR